MNSKIKVFAFIFARGGSKGIPGKNLKILNGKSLLQRSVEFALEHESIDEVFVSTDCPAIVEEGEKHGAQIIDRPPELASDTSIEWLSWQHAVKQMKEDFDVFLSLPTTAPLRSQQDISACIELATSEEMQNDLVITMSSAFRNPYFNMVRRTPSGLKVVIESEGFGRRQDAPEMFDMTTVAYATSPKYILASTGLFEGRVNGVLVPKERAIDIDDSFDLDLAEFLIRKREGP